MFAVLQSTWHVAQPKGDAKKLGLMFLTLNSLKETCNLFLTDLVVILVAVVIVTIIVIIVAVIVRLQTISM